MTLKCSLLLLLGLVIAVTAKLNVPKIQALKQQTQVLSEQNPKNAPACFNVYRPRLDSISTRYEAEYTKCNTEYDDQIALEDSKWWLRRSQLDQNGVDSCQAINDCSSIVGYVEAFECFAQMGAEQSKSMYTLSANARQVSAEVKEHYQMIETRQTICLNEAENKYVKDTTHEYEQLNRCLEEDTVTNSPLYPRTTTHHTTTTPFRTTTTPRSTTTLRTTTTPRTTMYTADWFTTTTTRHTTTKAGPPTPP